jgi:hypothetical protein
MKKVTVQFGTSVHVATVAATATVGQVLADSTTKIILGYSDSVHGLINGVAQPNEATVPDGALLVVETRANSKAV